MAYFTFRVVPFNIFLLGMGRRNRSLRPVEHAHRRARFRCWRRLIPTSLAGVVLVSHSKFDGFLCNICLSHGISRAATNITTTARRCEALIRRTNQMAAVPRGISREGRTICRAW